MLQKKIDPKTIAKRIAGPINAFMKEHNIAIDLLPFSSAQFEQFLKLELLDNQMKIIMDEMLSTGKDPEKIIKEKWFDAPALDESELEKIIVKVLANNEEIVKQYKNGKTTTMAFFVGQVMKATGGKINPQVAQQMIQKILG